MALQITQNRNPSGAVGSGAYFATGNFIAGPLGAPDSQFSVKEDNGNGPTCRYVDKFDRLFGHLGSPTEGDVAARWDPNYVDATSASVGLHLSPIPSGNSSSSPFFVSDYHPVATTQRLFQATLGDATFHELSITDPTFIITVDAWPTFLRSGNVNATPGIASGVVGSFSQGANGLNIVFFPEMNGTGFAVALSGQVWVDVGAGPQQFTNLCVGVDLATGFASPLIPARYASGEHRFNRGPVFGESEIRFNNLQFLPDQESTHAQPKGELMLTSRHTAPGGDDARLYVKFVDFNPFAIAGVPNRIHLRETLFSRLDLLANTLPTGGPPRLPINAYEELPGLIMPGTVFTAQGSGRIQTYTSDVGTQRTNLIEASKAALPAFVSVPAPKGETITNREVQFQSEVTGSLGEEIVNAQVSFSMERLSTVAEDLEATGTPDEVLTVVNFPIDRAIFFAAGFAVFEDSGGGPVELTETTHYTVNVATGDITFITPHTVGGSVYTIRYAHTAAPATPGHGSVLDPVILTTINGVAVTRVLYPDDDTLQGHIDLLTADSPTV